MNLTEKTNDERIPFNGSLMSDNPKPQIMLDGDENFTVVNYEAGNFKGSSKIPECGKVTVTVLVSNEDGQTRVKFDLFLCRSMEWRLSGFFRSIGLKKRGEPLMEMPWDKVLGSRGRANFKPRTFIDSYGEEKTINSLNYFIDYDPDNFMDELPEGFVELTDDVDLPL